MPAILVLLAALLLASPTEAPALTPAIDNLSLPAGYRTAPPGSLGAVNKAGSSGRAVILIAGLGFGAGIFDKFLKANERKYRMYAVTLPGMDGTPAPPLPQVSYGDQQWTRNAAGAVLRLVEEQKLDRPVVVGHFLGGGQVALRLAIDHPGALGGVVVIGGAATAASPSRKDPTGKTPATIEERIEGVDRYLAPRYFKTVTRQAWLENMFPAAAYSVDPARGRALFDTAAEVPMPILIQYFSEYFASDPTPSLARLAVPSLILVPRFARDVLARTTWLGPQFKESWVEAPEKVEVADTGVFMMDDQPTRLAALLDGFIARLPPRP